MICLESRVTHAILAVHTSASESVSLVQVDAYVTDCQTRDVGRIHNCGYLHWVFVYGCARGARYTWRMPLREESSARGARTYILVCIYIYIFKGLAPARLPPFLR